MCTIEETKNRAELYKNKWITQRDWRSRELLNSYIKIQKTEIRPYSISAKTIIKRVIVFGKQITINKEDGSLKYTRDGAMKFTSGFEDVLATEEQTKQFETLVTMCESYVK